MMKFQSKEYMERVGFACMLLRMKLGKTQRDVAGELDCSPSCISRFEAGENDSATILFWYIQHGLDWRIYDERNV